MNLQTNRFRTGRAFDRQSLIDWLLTGNNQGPLIPTTDPTDTHHCAEPSGVLPPYVFLFAKLGALGRTRTDTYFYART